MARIISSDSHIMEPPTLWTERLDRGLRDRAPRIQTGDDGVPTIWVEMGGRLEPVLAVNNQIETELEPSKRLEVIRQDGIDAELIFPTIGLYAFSMTDAKLGAACAAAYNDWLAEIFTSDPKHFGWGAMIHVGDVGSAVAEIERTAALGTRILMLPMTAPPERPYHLAEWEPLWSAAADHDLAIGLHAATGDDLETNQSFSAGHHPATFLPALMRVTYPAPIALSAMMGSGVFDRHPGLKVVCVETGASFLGWMVESLTAVHASLGPALTMKHSPIDYVGRNIFATFMDDPLAIRNRDVTGIDALLWGSDYPHTEGTWPHSRAVLDRIFEGVPAAERHAITGGTAARLFHFDA